MTKQEEIRIHTGAQEQDGWCRWRYRDEEGQRCTMFLPRNVFAKLGLEFDKTYRIAVEEIEYDYT